MFYHEMHMMRVFFPLQVASLKDTIGKKDLEIERLQLLKPGEKRAVATRYWNSPSILNYTYIK